MRALPSLLVLLAACVSPTEQQESIPASEADVTASLYKQLEMVLDRQAALADNGSDEAARERAELLRLAAEIAVRIVRMDPQADIPALVEQVETARRRAEE